MLGATSLAFLRQKRYMLSYNKPVSVTIVLFDYSYSYTAGFKLLHLQSPSSPVVTFIQLIGSV